jgi:hypothetical protein
MINYPPKYIYYSNTNLADYRAAAIDIYEIARYRLVKAIPEFGLLASANIYFDKWVGEYEDLITEERSIFFFDGEKIRKKPIR